MSKYFGKTGKKLFQKHLEHYVPQESVYEDYTGSEGKQRRKKLPPLPPGLSTRDAKILTAVQRRAEYLDRSFSIFGLRFGWTTIIALFCLFGDVTALIIDYLLVVREAERADLPHWLTKRMHINEGVSFACGLVPFVGDLLLAWYKGNSRNAALLEEFLRIRSEEFMKISAEQEGAAGVPEGEKPLGLSVADAKQVKPGAGMLAGERPTGYRAVTPVANLAGSRTPIMSGTAQELIASRRSRSFFNKKLPTIPAARHRSPGFAEDMGNDSSMKKRE